MFGVVKLAPQPILKQLIVAKVVVDMGDSLPYQLAVAVMVCQTPAAKSCKHKHAIVWNTNNSTSMPEVFHDRFGSLNQTSTDAKTMKRTTPTSTK